MPYNYQLCATPGANYPFFIQISGRIPVLIRHFSMDIQLPLGATVKIETLEQAIDLFVTDGMAARNLSPQTRKNYRHDLVDLLAFLKDRGASNLAEISLRHLEAYQAEMGRRGYSSTTRNRKTHSIKSLFHFLHRLGITSHNIAEKLIPPSVQKHERVFGACRGRQMFYYRISKPNSRDTLRSIWVKMRRNSFALPDAEQLAKLSRQLLKNRYLYLQYRYPMNECADLMNKHQANKKTIICARNGERLRNRSPPSCSAAT
jgi:hypothetical protein